jgi:hypothetical protein
VRSMLGATRCGRRDSANYLANARSFRTFRLERPPSSAAEACVVWSLDWQNEASLINAFYSAASSQTLS